MWGMRVLFVAACVGTLFGCSHELSPPANDSDASVVSDAGAVPDAGVVDDMWDGGPRFFAAPVDPPISCTEFCASMNATCTSVQQGSDWVAVIADYGACKYSHYFCGNAPPGEMFCERPAEGEAWVYHPLVDLQCGCAREAVEVDAGP